MTVTKSCPMCGKTFTAKRTDARYCSASCRSRARRGTPAGVLGERIHDVKEAITALADVAGEEDLANWTEVWRHVAAHMRAEIARIGRTKG